MWSRPRLSISTQAEGTLESTIEQEFAIGRTLAACCVIRNTVEAILWCNICDFSLSERIDGYGANLDQNAFAYVLIMAGAFLALYGAGGCNGESALGDPVPEGRFRQQSYSSPLHLTQVARAL